MIPQLATGMVLGKFLPPHAGHLYLIGCARRQVRRLVVIVERVAGEPIPSTTRLEWLRALAPDIELLHLDRLMPQEPADCADFWPRWRQALRDLLPFVPDAVFASETYGHRLAQELEARFLPVDPARQVIPVSGSAIRADPAAHARFLSAAVLAYYGLAMPPRSSQRVRRVAIVGPESTGKSTLARRLAAEFDTLFVPEYAETLIAAGVTDPTALTTRDLEDFARGQHASEDSLADSARSWLICDSDALTTQLYAERLLGICPRWIAAEAAERRYDLTLLCAPDVPWQPDLHRIDCGGRAAMFRDFSRALADLGRRTVVLRGDWQARQMQAMAVLQSVETDKGSCLG